MRAELLLRAGALAGWLGSSDQTEDQETAKNFITQSAEIFEKLGRVISLAETRGELAVCYWRDGSYDEARIHLEAALNLVGDQDAEVKAVLLIRAAIVEGKTPLGRILINHDVLRRIEPTAFLEVTPGAEMMRWFGLDKAVPTYGRLALIHCDGQPAIELLEIVVP